MRALVFPGQAAALRAVPRVLLEKYPPIKHMFEEAQDVFGIDFSSVDLQDEKQIRSGNTVLTQPLIFLSCMGAYLQTPNSAPEMVAGHSLGEILALTAAGALTMKAALQLIRARSTAMQDACDSQRTGMVAIIGLGEQEVQQVCESWNVNHPHNYLVISNFNSPRQFVISGSEEGLAYASGRLKSADRVVRLATPGAFHSPYMIQANEIFKLEVKAIDIQEPICPIYLNTTGRSTADPAEIRNELLHHMVSPVRWTETIQGMISEGATEFEHVGSGGGLPRLIQEINTTVAISSTLLYDLDGRQAPETADEHILIELWTAILHMKPEAIGRGDSFYRLGGDSISAMRLVALARSRGFLLSASSIMQNPILSDQATLLEQVEVNGEDTASAPFSQLRLDPEGLETAIIQAAEAGGFARDQIEDIYPCTPLQESLLAATSFDSNKYITKRVYELRNTVSSHGLIQAWKDICSSIDILRTRIVDIPNLGLVQVVSTKVHSVSEWSSIEEFKASQRDPMGLGTSLASADLVHVSSEPGRRLFILSAHHAVYDGWSLPLIHEQLRATYNHDTIPTHTPFKNFAKYLTSLDTESSRQFWIETISGHEATVFPTAPKAPQILSSQQTFQHDIPNIIWPRGDFLPSSILTTAWSVVASRYSDSDQVVFGSVTTGRQAVVPGIERVIGPTIATVPVRVHVTASESVTDLLQRVQKTALDVIPFEQTGIQTIRKYNSDLEQLCQFQTLLIIQPPVQDTSTSGSNSLFISAESHAGNGLGDDLGHSVDDFGSHGLSIQIFLGSEGVSLMVTHDVDILQGDSARRIARQFESVVRQVCRFSEASNTIPVAALSLDTEEDRQQIWQWNAQVPPLIHGCVHNLIIKAASRYPDNAAVCAWDGDLTHSQLDELSTQLARHLVALGLRVGSIVPLCFEKSLWVMVAIMGVMKAGGTLVAMDVGQPLGRLRQIVDKVQPRFILCSAGKQDLAAALRPDVFILPVSSDLMKTLGTASEVQLPNVGPTSLLYVVFTSGSTGTPKGATISHANFCSAIHYQREPYRYSPTSRVFDFVSYAFDVTWLNILHTFAAGGCVCVPSEDDRKSDISMAIKKLRANTVHAPPSVARLIDPEAVPELKLVSLGGEPVLLSDVTRWGPGVEIIQAYGPAECTPPVMLSYRVDTDEAMGNIGHGYGIVPWIVDADDPQKLAPIGVVGELVIEGPLMGRGYLGDPEKTAAVFLDSPTWLVSGCSGRVGRYGRVYRTGDLVRYEHDGSIRFLGRKDAQVKVRGQRIELGEVEVHIERLLQGRYSTEVVVDVFKPAKSASTVLSAFIAVGVDTSDSKATVDLLHNIVQSFERGLKEALPGYMIPSVFIPVESIPTTGTGKKDRRRLREIGSKLTLEELASFNPLRQDKRQPTTEWEHRVQLLVSEVLGINALTIGIDDSFFQVGGDSIAAMRLVGLARTKYKVKLAVGDIFKDPRLNVLAELAEAQVVEADMEHEIKPFSLMPDEGTGAIRLLGADILGVPETMIEDMYPCTPLQEGLLASTSLIDRSYVVDKVFQIMPHVDLSRFRQAWQHVFEQTPILRTRIIEVPSRGLFQVVLREKLPWVEFSSYDELIRSDKSRKVGLGLPLLWFGLLPKHDGNAYFSWKMHHALYDGISIRILIGNLMRAYQNSALSQMTPFSHFIASVKETEFVSESSKFWEEQLGDSVARPFPSLPTPAYRPVADQILVRHLRGFKWPVVDLTPASILRAVWALLISRYTASDESIFGAVVNGRQAAVPGIESIMGPTIATVPVHVKIHDEDSALNMIRSIQSQAVDMIPFEQAGLHHIRRINPQVERNSQFNTLLHVQLQSDDEDVGQSCPLWTQNFPKDNTANDVLRSTLGTFNSYALLVQCTVGQKGIDLKFEFDSSVIREDSLVRMSHQFEKGLKHICSTDLSATKVKDINFLSEQDLDDLWSTNASVPEPIRKCIHAAIQGISAQVPESLAIDAHDGRLTYRELENATSYLALVLISMGVKRGTIVPILFEKSRWTTVAALAVMKAGGTVVLLDTFLPASHLGTIIKQIKPAVSISSIEAASLAQSLDLIDNLVIDAGRIPTSGTYDPVVLPEVSPSDPAYIVFTSGSTGTPKGVIITHGQFCSSLHYQNEALGFAKATRVYDFASYSFDVCWSNMLQTLAAGACLCVPSESDRRTNLGESIIGFSTDTVDLTPSVSRTLDPAALSGLRTLLFGGEAVTGDDVARWSHIPTVINTYGPAETTPKTTAWKLSAKDLREPRIGTAVGMCSWVIDGNGKLAPVGTIGELWLEGPLVGEGYLNEPEKTANAFVVDPPWLGTGHPNKSIPGRSGKVYRTGDLVKVLPDGDVLYVGRTDSQVKINGQRTELDEIEHQVQKSLPNERTVMVVVDLIVPAQSNTKTLVAVLALRNKGSIDAAQAHEVLKSTALEVDSRLALSVPRYMIPSVFLDAERIPLGPTGKVDRRKLRQSIEMVTADELNNRNLLRAKKSEAEETQYTPSQSLLRKLWGDVLGIDPKTVTLEDSFFRLGGDSVLAMRLVGLARVEHAKLTVAQIFQFPQLHTLAEQVEVRGWEEDPDAPPVLPFSLLGDVDANDYCKEAASLLDISVDQIEDIYPVTSLQEGLLAVTEQQAGKYVAQYKFTLPDTIDIGRFKESWQIAAAHKPILRTRFAPIGQVGLVQVVTKRGAELFEYTSWDEREADEPDFGFTGQISRYEIVHPPGKSAVFVWTLHHALYDGWSFSKILDTVQRAYDGVQLDSVTPFNAFIRHVSQADSESAAKFWRHELESSHAVPYPKLPYTNYQPRPVSQLSHTMHGLRLKQTDFTISTLLQGAWSILASHHSNSDEVIFGTVVSGRQSSLPGIDQVAGPTIATVPVRTIIDGTERVVDFLQRVQDHAIRMIPFEQTGLQNIRQFGVESESVFNTLLLTQLGDDQNQIRGKLFATEFTSNEDESPARSVGFEAFSLYALLVQFHIQKDSVAVRFCFDEKVIEAALLDRMFLQFESLMRQLCSAETRGLRVSNLSTASERDLRDVWSWNPLPPPPVERCVHDVIVENMLEKKLQNALAVQAHDGQYTYGELDAMSTKLSKALLARNIIRPNTIIPLFFEKSKWTMVAILAVWKAGGAALTLDGNMSDEQIRAIIVQVSPRMALVSAKKQQRSLQVLDSKCLVLIIDEGTFNKLPEAQESISQVKIQPSDLVYVVFTSGSTGAPKGVMLQHRHLASASKYQSEALGYNENSRVYDFASFAFDVSWSNIIQTFTTGGCLCIPTDEQRQNDLPGSFHALKANLVDLTPSVSRTIDPSSMIGLERLLFGGEAVLGSDVARWKTIPNIKLVNTYGPAETTPKTTAFPLTDEDSTAGARFGVGLGLNTWIIEPDGVKIAAVGAVGELWLEGPLVAAGYMNNPAKTAASFVQNPLWLIRGASGYPGREGTLYRTGDLCRYNVDGTLSYVSRVDTQIKVGGQRVELAEIEHIVQQVSSKAGLNAAVDLITPKDSQMKILVAFVASDAGTKATKDQVTSWSFDLRDKLSKRLHHAVVPHSFIPLDEMPITTSGKTDRRRLIALGSSMSLEQLARLRSARNIVKRAPQSKEEAILRQIWAQVLATDERSIGIDDSFVEFGGDSISAMKVTSLALKQHFKLGAGKVISTPVLREQAKLLHPVQQRQTNGVHKSKTHGTTLFQSLCIDAARHAPPGWYGFLVVDLKSSFSGPTASHLCTWLWSTFDIFRAIFTKKAGVYLQEYASSSDIPMSSLGNVEETGSATQHLIETQGKEPLALGKPFVKFWILEGINSSRFIMRLPHAQYDGISMNQVMSQLVSYALSGLHEAPIHFSRYLDAIESSRSNGGLDYWSRLLQGASMTAPGPVIDDAVVAKATVAIPSIRDRLPLLPKSKSATPSSIFTALCARAIAHISGQSDIVFGRLASGRAMDSALSNVEGPCVNFVPVRVNDTSQADIVATIQKQLVEGMEFEGLGIDEICSASRTHISGDKSNHQFQVRTGPAPYYGFTVQYQNVEDKKTDAAAFAERGLTFYWQGQKTAETLFEDCIAIRAEETRGISPVSEKSEWHVIISGPEWRMEVMQRLLDTIVQFDIRSLGVE